MPPVFLPSSCTCPIPPLLPSSFSGDHFSLPLRQASPAIMFIPARELPCPSSPRLTAACCPSQCPGLPCPWASCSPGQCPYPVPAPAITWPLSLPSPCTCYSLATVLAQGPAVARPLPLPSPCTCYLLAIALALPPAPAISWPLSLLRS